MTCLGVLDRGERGDDNGTSLKEGGGIEISTTVLHSRAAPSLEYLQFVQIFFFFGFTHLYYLIEFTQLTVVAAINAVVQIAKPKHMVTAVYAI